MPSPSRRPALAALALAAGLAAPLAGCSGSAAIRVSGHHLYLHLTEYEISPGSVSVPYGPLTITATNDGVLVHDVDIDTDHLLTGGNIAAIAHVGIASLFPGRTATFAVPALRAGHYLIVSSIANQTDLGMQTTLVVRPP